MDLIVQYAIYQEIDGIESYKMRSKNPDGIPTILTYDHFTILADEIRYDPKKKIVETAGKVEVDDGKTKYAAKSVKVKIIGNQPTFEISK